ncbi:MAG: endonuclease III domain-containing protein [Candidatus Altiarchaeia archaeon]
MKTDLLEIHDALLEKFGPQDWWPGDTPFEVVIGAILTQSTSWTNVEKAIGNLKKKKLLSPEGIHRIDTEALALHIRSAGYYNAKARKLKEFMHHLHAKHDGDLDRMFGQDGRTLRIELLSIWGIGPETADSIVLYAAEKPEFVVDAYTKRIFSRLGYVKENVSYEGLKEFSEKNLPKDVKIYNEFHALLVRLGKEHCKKSNPICMGCPLEKGCLKKSIKKKAAAPSKKK